MKRIEGRHRIELFITFLRDFRKKVRQARGQISDERYKAIKASIEKTSNKTSADEDDKRIPDFERAIKKPIEEAIDKEIMARKIPTDD
mmetsp:Transcript_14270/g.23285  ORF Transcript_14270/g.23285 Transcript_14270/m.23285 type:complete len:88 (+) Transcript_14270:343-606(+)